MMVNTVQILFTLKVQHEYFGDAPVASLLQIGRNSTNPELYIRPAKNGIVFYTKLSKVSAFSGKIIFPLEYTDPLFINYTQLAPLQPQNKLYSVSNKQIYFFDTNQANASGFLYSRKAPLLALHPLRFTYSLDGNDQNDLDKILLFPLGSNNPLLELPKTLTPEGLSFDLSLNGEGAYTVVFSFHNKPSVQYDFFVSDALFQRPSPAVLQWTPPLQPAKNSGTEYTIVYDARPTYWRYIITGLSSAEWANFQILPFIINNKTIDFAKEKDAILLPNGQKAFSIYTNSAIPYQYNPAWKIKAALSASNQVQLPYAQPSILKTMKLPQSSKTVYCTEIFYQF